jgi:hypothetical protein
MSTIHLETHQTLTDDLNRERKQQKAVAETAQRAEYERARVSDPIREAYKRHKDRRFPWEDLGLSRPSLAMVLCSELWSAIKAAVEAELVQDASIETVRCWRNGRWVNAIADHVKAAVEAAPEPEPCVWQLIEGDLWRTTCDVYVSSTEVRIRGWRGCPYCMHPIKLGAPLVRKEASDAKV